MNSTRVPEKGEKGEGAVILNRTVRVYLLEKVSKLCGYLGANNSEQRDQALQRPRVGGVCLVNSKNSRE